MFAFAGKLGIGIAGGTQYSQGFNGITPDQFQNLVYGAEFFLQAEALPNVYIEPSISYINNQSISSSSAGLGLGINIRPRLGGFLIAPSFGVKGMLLLDNDLGLSAAIRNGQLNEYIESSTPRFSACCFAGASIFFSKNVSLDCHYQYVGLSEENAVEMVWAGISYYVNW